MFNSSWCNLNGHLNTFSRAGISASVLLFRSMLLPQKLSILSCSCLTAARSGRREKRMLKRTFGVLQQDGALKEWRAIQTVISRFIKFYVMYLYQSFTKNSPPSSKCVSRCNFFPPTFVGLCYLFK